MIQTRTATARRGAARPGPGGAAGSADPTGGVGASRRPDRAEAGSWPVRERSLLGPVLGIPPIAAVGLAVGLTAVGVLVDLLRLGTVGTVFQIGYGAGCLAAVAWVRRRSIFLPAIQPPLLLAVVVPVLAVLVGAPSSTAGITEHVLLAGAPLINAFPAMAVTTVLVLLVAGFRLLRQRTGPDDAVGSLRRRLSGRATDPSEPPAAPDRDRAARGRPARGRTGRDRPVTAVDPDSVGAPGDRAGGTQRPSGGRSPSARTPGDGARRNPAATPRGSAPSSKSAASTPAAPQPATSKPATSKPAGSKPRASKPRASKPGESKPGASNPVPGTPDSDRPTGARARKRSPDVRSAEDGTGARGGSTRSAPNPSETPARRPGRPASGRERSTGSERGSRSGQHGDGTRSGRPRRDPP